jgi:hypothetical protein
LTTRHIAAAAAVATLLAFPAGASAFHHVNVPASTCAANEQAGNNPNAAHRNAAGEHPQHDLGSTFPPGSPRGEQGAANCAGGR